MSASPVRVLAVCGSSRPDGHLEALIEEAAAAAESAGAEVQRLLLRELSLPVMVWGDAAQKVHPGVVRVRDSAAWADAFILGTPEYHGGMSGALKNWFDFLYKELAGKVAAVVASTGGDGGDMSITAVKNSFQWCHGFVLPFRAAAKESQVVDGALQNDKTRERLQRLGHDVVRYGGAIRGAWQEAQNLEGVAAGVAGLHR